MATVHDFVTASWRLTIREVHEEPGIFFGPSQAILIKDLGMRPVSVKFVSWHKHPHGETPDTYAILHSWWLLLQDTVKGGDDDNSSFCIHKLSNELSLKVPTCNMSMDVGWNMKMDLWLIGSQNGRLIELVLITFNGSLVSWELLQNSINIFHSANLH
jgi:hypothetical protein